LTIKKNKIFATKRQETSSPHYRKCFISKQKNSSFIYFFPFKERSAVRRRIRKLKSEAITYQDVCSENKKDASGKENYKNKKEMFKTSMASNEGGNYPRPGFTRKTVESIKDKQVKHLAIYNNEGGSKLLTVTINNNTNIYLESKA
jgi:hypothetical protein